MSKNLRAKLFRTQLLAVQGPRRRVGARATYFECECSSGARLDVTPRAVGATWERVSQIPRGMGPWNSTRRLRSGQAVSKGARHGALAQRSDDIPRRRRPGRGKAGLLEKRETWGTASSQEFTPFLYFGYYDAQTRLTRVRGVPGFENRETWGTRIFSNPKGSRELESHPSTPLRAGCFERRET
jgi:hypothetical protein